MDKEKQGRASPLAVVKTVFFAFFGVRRRAEHEQETVQLKPAQIIAAGIIGAALFVTGLILLVKFIIGRAAG